MKKRNKSNGYDGEHITGLGDGPTDSPIIITDGSFLMISLNNDYYPRTSAYPDASSTGAQFQVHKTSNTKPVIFRSDAKNFKTTGNSWTVSINGTDSTGAALALTITSTTGDPWTITVSVTGNSGNNLLTRQPQSGGDCRLTLGDFTFTKVILTNFVDKQGTAAPDLAIKNCSIHFAGSL